MRSLLVPTLVLTALLGGVPGCSSLLFRNGVLSYAQVQSIQRGQSEDEIGSMYGEPRAMIDFGPEETQIARILIYAAENPDGDVQELRISLNGDARVIGWTLGPKDRAN